HRLEVARGRDREARLDDVHAEPRELLGDLELLGRVERDAGRLLAVAQRRIQDQYPAGVIVHVASISLRLGLGLLQAGFAATRPPRAIPPEGGAEEVEGRAPATC